jgi:hypothetical protein
LIALVNRNNCQWNQNAGNSKLKRNWKLFKPKTNAVNCQKGNHKTTINWSTGCMWNL